MALGRWQNIICAKCGNPIKVRALRQGICKVKCKSCDVEIFSDNLGDFRNSDGVKRNTGEKAEKREISSYSRTTIG